MITDPLPASRGFKLANFLDVDACDDPAPFVDFLDRFASDREEMIRIGVEYLALQPGASVLDVGCGHGAAIPALAARVGPHGRVTGIDRSSQLIAEAQRRFPASALPIELRIGDAQALEFADETFDATRIDRVLVYVPEPRLAVRELVRVTRPGGRIVATEPDLGAAIIDSSDVATTREILAHISEGFPTAWIGRQLRGLFLDEGVNDVNTRMFASPMTDFYEWSRRMGIEDAIGAAVTSGRVTRTVAEAWLDDLRERAGKDRFFACNTLCMVSGTKSKAN
jgi:ubiquinone/menaquinone biosynthesis C-methylase UbiE